MARLRRPAILRRVWWRENWRENPLLWAELRRTFRSPWLTLLVVAMFITAALRLGDHIHYEIYNIEVFLRMPTGATTAEHDEAYAQVLEEWGEFWFNALRTASTFCGPLSSGLLGLLVGSAWCRDRTPAHREALALAGYTRSQMIVARSLIWGLPLAGLLLLMVTLYLSLNAVSSLLLIRREYGLFDAYWPGFVFAWGIRACGEIGFTFATLGLAVYVSLKGAPTMLAGVMGALVGLSSLVFAMVGSLVFRLNMHTGASIEWIHLLEWIDLLVRHCGIIPFAFLFWWLAMREVRRKYPA